MGVSKVILNGVTKVDLTGDTVEESNLLSGYRATGADGERVSGGVSDFEGATASADGTSGLVPAPSAGDQDKVLHGDGTWDTAYTHPTYTSHSSGLYKITVNTLGHVSAATAVQKSDITALGIPAQDTTYSEASSSAAGLMSTTDKAKLDGIVMAKWVNMGTISSLPVTKSLSGVTTDMICARMELGTPSAQRSDWTINTDTADSVTISGSISGSTTCRLLLVQAESGTAS